jgi:Tol biopolymer transport system component
MTVDGTGLRRLTDDMARDRQPRWSPDGKSLIFYSNREGGHYTVFSIRPDGSGLTRMLPPSDTDYYYGSLSPKDGSMVMNNFVYESFIVQPPFPAQSTQIQLIKEVALPDAKVQLATWSPDGRYLSGGIVSKVSAAAIGVGVFDVSERKVIKLSDDAGQWTAPFLPDSKRVMYLTTRDELVVIDIATRRRRVIPVAFGSSVSSEAFAISPDGKSLYFGASRTEANVWKVTTR